ncbi:hypothetical protein [Brevundimonas goettingensis]|uniref:Uncharacterized protein n=1 Tax=Brevundimonas goettingensis TaxID=2774190 RepID=A0A975C048_9CAUL|nr:hypothetical protein [Brevundimonas goettingensis]QTC90434.1 hypothetical protein IFJ75_14275 [Brevundimonas goettingensis]
MTNAPSDLSPDEIEACLTQLVRTVQAQSTLIQDLVQVAVALDPAAMEPLRDQAAKEHARACEERWTAPDADEREYLFRTRFLAYDLALARAGSFYKPCEVVSLDAVCRK